MHTPDLTKFLKGSWVTSFTAFIHDLPADKSTFPGLIDPADLAANPDAEPRTPENGRPPQLGAYYRNDRGQWEQTNGYYASAALLILEFDAAADQHGTDRGTLRGYLRVNRGGRLLATDIEGFYDIFMSVYGAIEADITIMLPSMEPEKKGSILISFRCFATNDNEIEFWCSSSKQDIYATQGVFDRYRSNISRGTLKRVGYSPAR